MAKHECDAADVTTGTYDDGKTYGMETVVRCSQCGRQISRTSTPAGESNPSS